MDAGSGQEWGDWTDALNTQEGKQLKSVIVGKPMDWEALYTYNGA